MKSFDFRGKFWIKPDGDIIDVTGDEHARYARAAMLDIPFNRMHETIPINKIFSTITLKESQTYFASDPRPEIEAVEFLLGGGMDEAGRVDPRRYVIEKWGWIRTNENSFYAWEWNNEIVSRLLGIEKFWNAQERVNPYSWIDLIGVKPGSQSFGGTYGSFVSKYTEDYLCR